MRWVLLLLLALNVGYLAFSQIREPQSDPYANVPPLQRLPQAAEIRLLHSELNPPRQEPEEMPEDRSPPLLPPEEATAAGPGMFPSPSY